MSQKSAHRLESTAGQDQGLTAADASDSGDSLFLTQNPAARPVRSARPRRRGRRSDLAHLEDSEGDSSSSSSQDEAGTSKRASGEKRRLPRFTFAFLDGSEAALPTQQNRILHNVAITGFFKCLSEFDAKRSLPTVDTDEDLSPLSEEEEESHTEAFRVVDKRCFVTAFKAASSQSWGDQRRRQRRENAGGVGEARPGGAAPSWRSDSAAPSLGRKSNGAAQSAAPIAGRRVALGAEEVEDHSDARVCEAPAEDGGWEGEHRTGRGNDQSVCGDVRVKRRRRRGQARPSGEALRREGPEDPSVPESVAPGDEPRAADEVESNERSLHEDQEDRPEDWSSRKRRKRKKNKSKAADTVNGEHSESNAVTTDCLIPSEGGGGKEKRDEGDGVRQSDRSSATNEAFNGTEGPKLKRRKNKRRTRELPSPPPGDAAWAGEAEGVHASTAAPEEGTGKSREGKKGFGEEVNIKMRSTEGLAEAQSGERMKRNKRATDTEASEGGVAPSERPEAVRRNEKRRTLSFLRADAAGKEAQTPAERAPVPAEGPDTPSAEFTGTPAEPDRCVKKKKRKRERDAEVATGRRAAGEREGEGSGGGPVTATEATEGAAVREEAPGKRGNGGTELLTNSAHLRSRGKKKKHADAPPTSHVPASESQASPSERVGKRRKLKRRLYNPVEGFLE